MSDDKANDWFILENGGEIGPLSEPEMRRHLRKSKSASLKVRQGTSEWHDADHVRQQIDALKTHGIYVRYANAAEGPFTLTRAHALIRSMDMDGIDVRTGAKGKWISADRWLRKIEELRQRKRTDVGSLSEALQRAINQQTSEPKQNADSIPTIAPVDSDAALPVAQVEPVEPVEPVEAVQLADVAEAGEVYVVEVVEDEDDIPVADLVAPPPTSTAAASPRSTSGQPGDARMADMAFRRGDSSRAASSTIHSSPQNSRPPSRRPQNPRTARKQNSKSMAIAVVGLLSVATVAATALLIFVLLRTGSDGTSTSQDAQQVAAINTQSEASRINGSMLGSVRNRIEVADAIAKSSPAPTGPPNLQAGTLFRPQFDTNSGPVDAGTAFAARMEDKPGTLIISAIHLFGPAGGLDQDIPSPQLPSRWNGLSLEDCLNRNWFGNVEMNPVLLRDAKPLPNSSVFGDVAACVVEDDSGFNPLVLSKRKPVAGERVWLVSRVLNSSSTKHPARVFGVEDGWLIYQFDTQDIELRATSGAPVVNRWGEVIAVNAGGGEENGVTIGVGTPVTKFRQALANQL